MASRNDFVSLNSRTMQMDGLQFHESRPTSRHVKIWDCYAHRYTHIMVAQTFLLLCNSEFLVIYCGNSVRTCEFSELLFVQNTLDDTSNASNFTVNRAIAMPVKEVFGIN
jgi:hypothetical protein